MSEDGDSLKLQEWPKITNELPPLSTSEFDALKESVTNHGIKYKIKILPDGRIIDGYHRWKILGDETPYEIMDVDEDTAIALARVLNLARRQLSSEQVKSFYAKIKPLAMKYRAQKHSQKETAEHLGISQQMISYWEKPKKITTNTNIGISCKPRPRGTPITKVPKSDYEAIHDRHKEGEAEEQIAADYKVTQQTINKIIKKTEETPESKIFKKRSFDVWTIAEQDLKKPFGDPEYPGAIPGDIVANVLLWFLPQGGKIIDPMAGGGVTNDVCRELGEKYQCLSYDKFLIKNYQYKPMITYNDIETGKLPDEAKNSDLIFVDPPYGPLKEYGSDIENHRLLMEKLAEACFNSLKNNGIVSVLMQNYYIDGECVGDFTPLIHETVETFEKWSFKQIFEVTVPLCGKVARNQEHMTHTDRRLMIFRKST